MSSCGNGVLIKQETKDRYTITMWMNSQGIMLAKKQTQETHIQIPFLNYFKFVTVLGSLLSRLFSSCKQAGATV